MAGLSKIKTGGIADGCSFPSDATATTQSSSDNSTKIATTAFVQTAVGALSSDSITEGNTTVEVVDTGSNGHITFDTEGSERMRIDSSGRVGIGATDNSDYSGSSDNLVIKDSASAGLTLHSGSSSTGCIRFADGTSSNAEKLDAAIEYNHNTEVLTLRTNDTARITVVDSTGRVGIGTTSPDTSLDVEGTQAEVRIRSSSGTNSAGVRFVPGGQTNAYYIYADGSRNLIFEDHATERMRIKSDGKVGIGTSSPGAILEVRTATQVPFLWGNTAARGGLSYDSSDNPVVRSESGKDLVIQTNGGGESNERMRIDDSGNVLIGHTSARGVGTTVSFPVQIEGESSSSPAYGGLSIISNRNDSDSSYLVLASSRGTTVGSSTIVQDNDTLGRIVFTGADGVDMNTRSGEILCEVEGTPTENFVPGSLVFKTCSTGTSTTQRMRIKSDGAVYLGTSASATPLARLHISDNHSYEMTSGVNRSDSMMQWTSDASAYVGAYFKSTRGYVASNTTEHSIGIYATATAKHQGGATGVYGYGEGNVGEGGGVGVYGESYSAYTGMPTSGVKGYRRRGPSNGWGFGVWGQAETSLYNTNWAGCFEILSKTGSDSNNEGILIIGRDTDRTHAAVSIRSGTSGVGTQVGSITFGTSSTAYNTSSDYRLKENIVDLTGAITRVKTIPVHRFNFIAEPDKTVDGFVAHEISSIVPEAVTGTKDEVENEYDNDGNVTNTTPVYQSIDQAKLVPLLTAALQEAIAEIETLKTKVAALEAG